MELYPNFPYQTPKGMAFLCMLKQLDGLLWAWCQKHEANFEGELGKILDIEVYSNIIECAILDEKKEKK